MTPSFGGGSLLGPILWTVGSDYLTADNKPGFTTPEVKQSFAKMRELFLSASRCCSARPTDWWDPSSFTQGLAAMQWCGLWAMPGIQKAIGDDFGVVAWPAFSSSVGKPSTFLGGWGAMVSAKSAECRRGQGVHQVAVDRQHRGPGGLQPQLRIPHPAAEDPGRQGDEAAVRASRRRAEDLQRLRGRRQSGLDAEDEQRVRRRRHRNRPQGRRHRREPGQGGEGGQRRARLGCSADMSAPTLTAPAADAAPPARRVPEAGSEGSHGAFWLFVGPFVVGLVIFVYVPIVWSVVLSFSRAQNTVTPGDWVGLQNYIDLLQPGPFLSSLLTFTIFAAFIVPLTFALSLGLALLLNGVRFDARVLPLGVLPARPPAPTSSPRWSGSCRSSTAFGSGWPTPCSAGSVSRTSPGWPPPIRPGTGW